ncbi:MAG: COX15/CtaA family protein, partial [candidate division NC10 bacterium]
MAHRLALVTLAATFVLILFGGLVTNSGAALAVPDWPSTYGYNMFLFPWARMVGGIFYEHSHRLIGAVTGLLTLALAAALWRAGGRLRWLGLAAVAAVVTQGVLGGLRVVLLKDTLAIFHGSLAQAFFGLLAAIALLTSPRARAAAGALDPSLRGIALVAVALVYVQIVTGALLTHVGRIDLHLPGAALGYALVPVVTARLRRSGDLVAAPMATALLALFGVQFLLGVGSYLARFSSIWIPGEQATMLLLPVTHRLVASLILGAAVVLAIRVMTAGAEPYRASLRPPAVPPRLASEGGAPAPRRPAASPSHAGLPG